MTNDLNKFLYRIVKERELKEKLKKEKLEVRRLLSFVQDLSIGDYDPNGSKLRGTYYLYLLFCQDVFEDSLKEITTHYGYREDEYYHKLLLIQLKL